MPRPATPSRPRPAPEVGGAAPAKRGGRRRLQRGPEHKGAPGARGGAAAAASSRGPVDGAGRAPARTWWPGPVAGARTKGPLSEAGALTHKPARPPWVTPAGCDDRQRRDAVPRAARRRCSCGTANPSRRRGQYRTPELSASGFIAPAASGSARRGAEGWPHAGCVPSSCYVSAKRRDSAGGTEGLPAGTGTPRPASAAPPVARRLAREPSPSPAATPSPRRPQETETRASCRQVQPRGPRDPKGRVPRPQTNEVPNRPPPLRGRLRGGLEALQHVPRTEAVPEPGGSRTARGCPASGTRSTTARC